VAVVGVLCGWGGVLYIFSQARLRGR